MRKLFSGILVILFLLAITVGCIQKENEGLHVTPEPSIIPTPETTESRPVPTPTPVISENLTILRKIPWNETKSDNVESGIQAGLFPPSPEVKSSSFAPEGGKRSTSFISNCTMARIASFTTDPEYGLHGRDHSSLMGISLGEYRNLLRTERESRGPISYCDSTQPEPYWVWMIYNAVITQPGDRTGYYAVTLYVDYAGMSLPVISSFETFEPDKEYRYTVYIPMTRADSQDVTQIRLYFDPDFWAYTT